MAAELRMAFAVATGAAIGVAVATYLAQKRQPKAQNTSCASSRGCWGETTASGTSTCCIGGSSSNDPGCCEDSGSDFGCCNLQQKHQHDHNSSDAMRALVSAFNDAAAAPPREQQTPAVPSIPAPSSSGPPPLGSILQLAKESGKSRKECKAALIAHGNDYDAARWSLMPNPNGAAPSQTHCCTDDGHAASAAVPGTFEPAPKFAGGRPGWLYKRGPLGVGYYRDAPMSVAVKQDG